MSLLTTTTNLATTTSETASRAISSTQTMATTPENTHQAPNDIQGPSMARKSNHKTTSNCACRNTLSAQQTNSTGPTAPNDNPKSAPHHPVPPCSLPRTPLCTTSPPRCLTHPPDLPCHHQQWPNPLLYPTQDCEPHLGNDGVHCQTHWNNPVHCRSTPAHPSSATNELSHPSL
jgi:hypothetical protein